jgi:mediator of RNA polymerase II transcription subunit 21
LLFKVGQIDHLIGVLPGVETSAREQEERIRGLEELKDAEVERGRAVRELEGWRERVEGGIGGLGGGGGGRSGTGLD